MIGTALVSVCLRAEGAKLSWLERASRRIEWRNRYGPADVPSARLQHDAHSGACRRHWLSMLPDYDWAAQWKPDFDLGGGLIIPALTIQVCHA